MTVQRYTKDDSGYMDATDYGDWVRYEDHDQSETQAAVEIKRLRKAVFFAHADLGQGNMVGCTCDDCTAYRKDPEPLPTSSVDPYILPGANPRDFKLPPGWISVASGPTVVVRSRPTFKGVDPTKACERCGHPLLLHVLDCECPSESIETL